MTLMEQIRAAQLEARKSHDTTKASLLTTLIGEAANIGKNDGNRETTDAEVVAIIKKFIKNIDSTIDVIRDRQTNHYGNMMIEKDILEKFLPSQFSEEQLTIILVDLKNALSAGPKDMGKMLGLLKTRFEGQYDGKMASEIAKAILAG